MHIKNDLGYSLTLNLNDEKLTIPLRLGSFYIGDSDKCLVQIDFGDPSRVYMLDASKDSIVLKSLNPLYSITIGDKNYTEVTINSSMKIDLANIVLDFSFDEKISSNNFSGKINLHATQPSIPKEVTLPPVPVDVPETTLITAPVEPQVVVQPVKASFININGDTEDANISKLVYIDDMLCDISFMESDDFLVNDFDDLNLNYDHTEYIDYEEIEVEKYEIAKSAQAKSIEISILHNGVLLSQDYFPFSHDKIFASNKKNSRKIAHISFIEGKEKILLLEKAEMNSVDCFNCFQIPGFKLSTWDKESNVAYSEEKSLTLAPDVAIVHTKDLHQIVIKESFIPPTLDRTVFFRYDEQLVKFFAIGFSAILLPLLLTLMLTKVPDLSVKKKEDLVVIYKKKLSSNTTKNITKTESTQEATRPKTKVESESLAKPKEQVKVVEKKSQTLPKPAPIAKSKPSQDAAKSSKSVAQNKAATNTQVKASVKSYSFNTSSQYKALLGTSANTAAQEVENKKSFVAEGISGDKLTKSTARGEINNLNSGAKGFSGSDIGSVDKDYGSEGLSGKSGIDTAYMESRTKVLGAIDPNLIRKILREYIPQFRYCYHQELRKDSTVAGIFDLEFKIDSNGKGSSVNILTKDKGFSESGVGCIRNVIGLIQFPKVKGGGFVEVVQPLNFQSSTR